MNLHDFEAAQIRGQLFCAMVFSSTLFLFYLLPGFLLLYYMVPTRFKDVVALLASLLFYAWGGLRSSCLS